MRSTFRKTFAKYVTLFIVPVVAFSCLFVYINMRTNEKSATNYLDGVQKQMCGELDILYSRWKTWRFICSATMRS